MSTKTTEDHPALIALGTIGAFAFIGVLFLIFYSFLEAGNVMGMKIFLSLAILFIMIICIAVFRLNNKA